MYSTCLFCHRSLGANESVESFPVGRRLAFDQANGRLWVICLRCRKWNLTPLEERWEAIETCERLYRDARKRVATDQIGLAKVNEGLELVRIGEPLRLEFAAWRYGDQFHRRRVRTIALTTLGMGAGVGYLLFGIGGSGVMALASQLAWNTINFGATMHAMRRRIARIPGPDGALVDLRARDSGHWKIVPSATAQGWGLRVGFGRGGTSTVWTLEGDDARRTAVHIVPAITAHGGSRKETAAAVDRLEQAGGPDAFLAWLARNPRQSWNDAARVNWLGVEMAVNEEHERRALQDELRWLELAWEEAEEIARISDSLAVPPAVGESLDRLKHHSNP